MPRTTLYLLLPIVSLCQAAAGQSERVAAQIPDYRSLPDSTAALQAKIDAGGSLLLGGSQRYRITRPFIRRGSGAIIG